MKPAAILAMLALVGCNKTADDRICLKAPAHIANDDMNACVHQWAYRLARSGDPATVVAKAVVQACNDVANAVANKAGNEQAQVEAYKGTLGVGEMQALFRVVQARAGNCDIP